MKKTGLLLLMLAVVRLSSAQITLTNSDLASPGDQIIDAFQLDASPVAPVAGPGQTYVFSESDTSIQDTTTFIPVSATPFASLMTTANMASGSGLSYAYYSKTAASYALTGLSFELPPLPLAVPVSAIPLKFSGPIRLLQFPASNGMNLTSQATASAEFDYDTVITIGGLPATVSKVRVQATIRDTSIINGYGNASFVSGTYPCLRNEQRLRISFKLQVYAAIIVPFPTWIDVPANLLPGGGIPEIRTTSLLFWTNGRKAPIASLTLDSAGLVQNASYQKDLLITSNRNLISANPEFEFQVMPNPAASYVELESAETIKNFKLFSATGTKIWESQEAGPRFDLPSSGLQNGVYWGEWESVSGKKYRKRLIIKN
jgi:hypothetical protein